MGESHALPITSTVAYLLGINFTADPASMLPCPSILHKNVLQTVNHRQGPPVLLSIRDYVGKGPLFRALQTPSERSRNLLTE